jgi:hypothetical protein
MNKNRVDTFYEQTEDMLLKTTGAYMKDTSKPSFVTSETHRTTTSAPYEGGAYVGHGEGKRHRVRETFQPSSRPILKPFQPGTANMDSLGKGAHYDHGKSNLHLGSNERASTACNTYNGGFSTVVKAFTAPFTDILKVTAKEHFVVNPRSFGQMDVQVPSKMTVYDSDQVTRTTIKETLVHDTVTAGLQLPPKQAVYDPDEVARATMRETLDTNDLLNLRGHTRHIVVDPSDIPRTTTKETTEASDRSGNIGDVTDTSNGGYLTNDVRLALTQKQLLSDGDYIGIAEHTDANGYKTAPTNLKATQKQCLSDNDYFGDAGPNGNTTKHMAYEAGLATATNAVREVGLANRVPTKSSATTFNSNVNYSDNRKAPETISYSGKITGNVVPPSKDFVSFQHNRKIVDKQDVSRFDPALLDAFRKNPYTHSLESSV